MNQLAAAQTNAPARSLLEIEAEILAQKRTIGRSIVVIGQALSEAKGQIAHGEWGKWLAERVNFSQSTADNYMRIAEQVGGESRLLDLPYTKILALLSVPEGERESFADANHVEDKSVSEIKRLIAERDAARLHASKAEDKIEEQNRLIDRKNRSILTLENQLSAERAKEPDTVTVEKEVPPADYELIKNQLRNAQAMLIETQQELEEAEYDRDRALEELEAEKACGAPDPLDVVSFCDACAMLLNRLVAAPVAGGLFRTKTDTELEHYERNVGLVMEWAVKTQDVLLEIRTERSGSGFVFELP